MGYGCGDSFPIDFEPNEIPFGSENRKENCHHDHIPFSMKGNGILVFSVQNQHLQTESIGIIANSHIVMRNTVF